MERFRKALAELIGTFVLVFVSCNVAVISRPTTVNVGYIATAVAFGLALIAMAYSIGNVSGCHINPAVSLAMLISGRMCIKDFFAYIIAQIAGGILGAVALGFLWGFNPERYGANSCNSSVSMWTCLGIECILTFIFVLTILGVTDKKEYSGIAGLIIGGTLTAVHLVGIPYTGTSVNPARSIGPAILAGGKALNELWIFIVAPLVGAVVAAIVYKIISGKKCCKCDKCENKDE